MILTSSCMGLNFVYLTRISWPNSPSYSHRQSFLFGRSIVADRPVYTVSLHVLSLMHAGVVKHLSLHIIVCCCCCCLRIINMEPSKASLFLAILPFLISNCICWRLDDSRVLSAENPSPKEVSFKFSEPLVLNCSRGSSQRCPKCLQIHIRKCTYKNCTYPRSCIDEYQYHHHQEIQDYVHHHHNHHHQDHINHHYNHWHRCLYVSNIATTA